MIAVTFALPIESAGLIRVLRARRRYRCGNTDVVSAEIDNRTIEILHTGVGEKVCRQRLTSFLKDRQFNLLISAGFAGALSDDVSVADLLLAENFSTAPITRAEVLLSRFAVHAAKVATVANVIASPSEREEVARRTGAVAVDMETEFIAQACAEHGLPLLALRAISDTPARPLPVPPAVLFDVERQKTRTAQLSLYLLQRPRHLPRLIAFARQVRTARRRLTAALETLLRSEVL